MGSVSIAVSGSAAATQSSGGGWRWWKNSGGGGKNGNNNVSGDLCDLSSAFGFFVVSFVVLGSIAGLYSRLMLTTNVRAGLSALGCREDNEGSWAIGVFYGDSPFSLKAVEDVSFTV
nr:glycosyltransferase family protein 64 protein C5-like [Ipomoea batatas]